MKPSPTCVAVLWLSCGWMSGNLSSAHGQEASSMPVALRCEYLVDPLGIDDLQPRLSWQLDPAERTARGQCQTAFQVLVARSRSLLDQDAGDCWDSGRTASDQSIHVPYQGQPLAARSEYWWKVRIWDERNNVSAWSAPARWSMGLLTEADWSGAQWIGCDQPADEGVKTDDIKAAQWLWYPEGNPAHDAPVATRYFRRTLNIPADRRVVRALAFFAGDDQCVFMINGTQAGVGRGHPNLIGIDVGPQLHAGANQLAVAATNVQSNVPNNPGGWIGAVRVEFAEGAPLVIHSDGQWRTATEPAAGWEQIGCDDSAWVAAKELGQAGIPPWGIPWADRWHSEHRRLPARYVRREFELPAGKILRRATAYVCGLGFFDLHVNGQLVGDQLMQPALTGYDKRDLYVTFDVTQQLRPGTNAIGIVLSNGRFFAPRLQTPAPMHSYGYPKLIAQVDCEFADGSQQTIVSDESWRLTTDGPIRGSNEFDGEEYDARCDLTGWAEPGYAEAGWQPAQLVSPPGGKLEAQMIEPIRVAQILEPQRIVEARPGVWMVDFGQAFYGVVRLRVSGPAGTRVSIRTSFNVLPDGTLNYINDRSALNTDVYTLRGRGRKSGTRGFAATPRGGRRSKVFPARPPRTVLPAWSRTPLMKSPALSPAPIPRSRALMKMRGGVRGCRTEVCPWSRTATNACPGPATRRRLRRAKAGRSTSPASMHTSCTTTASIRVTTEVCRRFSHPTGRSTAKTSFGRASPRSFPTGTTTSTGTIGCCATTTR